MRGGADNLAVGIELELLGRPQPGARFNWFVWVLVASLAMAVVAQVWQSLRFQRAFRDMREVRVELGQSWRKSVEDALAQLSIMREFR